MARAITEEDLTTQQYIEACIASRLGPYRAAVNKTMVMPFEKDMAQLTTNAIRRVGGKRKL